jgi:tetratricopeptide (TPR) repeat protein
MAQRAQENPHLVEGEKHLESGDWAAAEKAFRQAAETDPKSAAARSKLGVALAHQRRLEEAEQEFARALTIDPRYAPAWSNLGNVYRESGRTEQALEAYKRAVDADPDYWIAHQNLGGLYKQMGRTGEAIASLRRATKLSVRGALRPSAQEGRRPGCMGGASVLALMITVAVLLYLLHG